MEILYVLIPVSMVLVALAIGIFNWAVKSGQYDDLEGPAHSILYDDDEDMIPGPDDNPKSDSSDHTGKNSQPDNE